MRLVRSMQRFPFDNVAAGSVVTIGAFDGLHLGHQQLLRRVTGLAEQWGLPSIVMSFEPTPREFFARDEPPARLMRFREKFDALREVGVDLFFCPRFDAAMRDMNATSFMRLLLLHTFNVRHLVVGDDFRFARGREGNIDLLRRVGLAAGFATEQVPKVLLDGERVSSTLVRQVLGAGDLQRARQLLGRWYRMSGRVVPGQRLGRKLGYPTANVNLQRRQCAISGIFAVRVVGVADRPLDAVASVGSRPTFDGDKPLLEVHLFDFDADIYGRYIHVDFVARLREQIRFDSAEELVQQMHCDAQEAREILTQ